MLLFVYGTMKRRCRNFSRLYERNAVYIGDFATRDRFDMYHRGKNNAPIAVRSPDGNSVQGELYAIPDEAIDDIDGAEGHPVLYERQHVDLRGFHAIGVPVHMYVYVGALSEAERQDRRAPVDELLSYEPEA